MSDDSEQPSYLPWVLAALVLVVGGAKLDAARPLVARALAVAIPIVPVAIGAKRVEGGGNLLERGAAAVGWVTILAGEVCVAGGLFRVSALEPILPVARLTVYAALAGALFVHILEARSLGKARFAGYAGIASGFSSYIAVHTAKDAFASVFGAFFIGMAVGGAALLVGELVSRGFKKA